MASFREGPNNVLYITVFDGYDSNAKKRRITRKYQLPKNVSPEKKEKEKNRLAILLEEEVKRGIHVCNNNITLSDFIDYWFEENEDFLKPKTLQRYKDFTTRIKAALGHKQVQRLERNHINLFYKNLQEEGIRKNLRYKALPTLKSILDSRGITNSRLAKKAGVSLSTVSNLLKGGSTIKRITEQISKALEIKKNKLFVLDRASNTPLSAQTIAHHHKFLHTVLNYAIREGIIATNPAQYASVPKVEKKEMGYYEHETIAKIFKLLDEKEIPIKYIAIMYIAIYTGCRLGELVGLEWNHIDFDKKKISIKQAAQYLPGKGIYTKTPKNETSNRTIDMPDKLINVLMEYKKWWNNERERIGDLWEGIDCLFIQRNGHRMFPQTPARWFEKFVTENNLPKLNFHGLRHTAASLLISEAVDVQTISKRLGHSNPVTTLKVYSHFLEKSDRLAAEKLNNLFNDENHMQVSEL
ncbi:MAG: tyrosine-type recombinase/integrase [Bacteroidales bacterium]|nr:tyrosine-type recombinase/integrase [Bacteroidales bacterium]